MGSGYNGCRLLTQAYLKNMDENKHFYNLWGEGNPEEGEMEIENVVE